MTVPMPPHPAPDDLQHTIGGRVRRQSDEARFPWARLKMVAEIRSSNVDKLTLEGQRPVRLCNYVDVYKNDRITADISFMSATATLAQLQKFGLKSGDVVITKDSETPEDIAVPALVDASAEGVVCGYHLAILRAIPQRVLGSFLFWALKSNSVASQFSTRAQGITRFGLTIGAIGDIRVPLPSLPEQRAIADFLDRETAKIDALIAKQEEFIRVTEERKVAVYTRSLYGGLGENQNLVSSGVEWIGDIPSDWRVERAKFFLREIDERSGGGDEELLTVSHLTGVTPRAEKSVGMFIAESADNNKCCDPDDLVVNTMWAWMGAMGVAPMRGMVSPSYAVYRQFRPTFIAKYLDLLCRSRPFVAEVNRHSKGVWSSRLRLYPEALLNFRLPIPPLGEQQRILDQLDSDLRHFDAIAAKANIQTALLREHRSALITAAVTGQIAVRGLSAKPHKVASNDNRKAIRVVVGAEIVSRQGSAKNFGRVKLQKLLYLAEVHAGIHELAGNYVREAAGPLAPDLLSETERGMEAAGFYRTVVPVNEGDGYTYSRIGKTGSHGDQFAALLGDRAAALSQLIDRFKDYDKRQVEAITTLYAVWNDALLDGETPSEDRIIRGVLEEWHPEKKDKFTATDLKPWLAWMRRNGVVPTGTGPRTQLDRLFV